MDFTGMKAFVAGGAGFIGSHAAETLASQGAEVTVFDNLSRARLLNRTGEWSGFNWDYLSKVEGVRLVKGDILDSQALEREIEGADVVIHAAAQTAVTTSVTDPRPDFMANALGTFSVLEAVRTRAEGASVVYCSTNKVYGNNVNAIGVEEGPARYSFEKDFATGIPEDFPIDAREHTPYGCSKLAGDIYMQDYAQVYGIKTGIFRMSCIYGERQFGVEEQGWLAHFVISTLKDRSVTIFGDGKQVRDVLYASDLIAAYLAFIERSSSLRGEVFNMGGGHGKTLSLLELISLLEKTTGRKLATKFSDWRPADQKVYVSDISKAMEKLSWAPQVEPVEGVVRLCEWVGKNSGCF